MPHLRVIYENTADIASISASSTAGALTVGNLKRDIKGLPHRSTTTSCTYTLTWGTPTLVGGIALPLCNLSQTATIRVRIYSDASGTSLIKDSGTLLACSGPDLGSWDWLGGLGVNSSAYGAYSKSSVWFDSNYPIRRCVVEINDASNPNGYVEVSRLVVGPYWEPKRNVQNGTLILELVDGSESERSDAGDLISTRSTMYERLALEIAYMEEVDRSGLLSLARKCGSSKNVLVCVFPDNTNETVTSDYTVYGKFNSIPITQQYYGFYSVPLEITGW